MSKITYTLVWEIRLENMTDGAAEYLKLGPVEVLGYYRGSTKRQALEAAIADYEQMHTKALDTWTASIGGPIEMMETYRASFNRLDYLLPLLHEQLQLR